MTRIDFYILSDTTRQARLDFACRLAETIYRKGYRLHVHTVDEAMEKTYQPEQIETRWYQRWEMDKRFVPSGQGEPFSRVTTWAARRSSARSGSGRPSRAGTSPARRRCSATLAWQSIPRIRATPR